MLHAADRLRPPPDRAPDRPVNPALLAKQVATLDHIALGRFRLGMGTGWRVDDYTVMGASFDDPGAALDELIDALRATWTGAARDAISETLSALEDVGVEEVCLWPQARGLGQLHAMADTVGL